MMVTFSHNFTELQSSFLCIVIFQKLRACEIELQKAESASISCFLACICSAAIVREECRNERCRFPRPEATSAIPLADNVLRSSSLKNVYAQEQEAEADQAGMEELQSQWQYLQKQSDALKKKFPVERVSPSCHRFLKLQKSEL